MGIIKNSLDERKNITEIIFIMSTLIMQHLFIHVKKGVSFMKKKEVNICLFFFKLIKNVVF